MWRNTEDENYDAAGMFCGMTIDDEQQRMSCSHMERRFAGCLLYCEELII